MNTPHDTLREQFLEWFSDPKPPIWNEAYRDWAPAHIADWFLSRTVSKEALLQKIEEIGSDPPLESNERRRGFHEALDALKEFISNGKE